MERYANWCRKQGSHASCSPGLVIFGAVVVLAAVLYHYRHIILMTLIGIGITLAVLGAVALAVVLAMRYLEARAERAEEATAAAVASLPESAILPEPEPVPAPEPVVTHRQSAWDMLAEASTLADDRVGLAFTPDGKTLEVVRVEAEQK